MEFQLQKSYKTMINQRYGTRKKRALTIATPVLCQNYKLCDSQQVMKQNLQDVVETLYNTFKESQKKMCRPITTKSTSLPKQEELDKSQQIILAKKKNLSRRAQQLQQLKKLNSERENDKEFDYILSKLETQQKKQMHQRENKSICQDQLQENKQKRPQSSKPASRISQSQQVKMHNRHTLSYNQVSPMKEERFRILEPLGIGAYAKVYKALDTFTNKEVAIKICKPRTIYDQAWREAAQKEIKNLLKLFHPNIIKLLGVQSNKRSINLILEFFGKETLYSILKQKPNHRMCEKDFKDLFRQLVEAVAYCHNNNISHRDIKIENTIVSLNTVKLIDFGLASEGQNFLVPCGTPSYMSPEIFKRNATYKGDKADVWALGVVLYVSLVGKFPFEGKNDLDLERVIQKGKIRIPKYLSPGAQALLQSTLQMNPEERISAQGILKSEFFSY